MESAVESVIDGASSGNNSKMIGGFLDVLLLVALSFSHTVHGFGF
jgi:hypothetical protein